MKRQKNPPKTKDFKTHTKLIHTQIHTHVHISECYDSNWEKYNNIYVLCGGGGRVR